MNNNISKSMSYLLRHGLEKENINHCNGFVLIDDVIGWLQKNNTNINVTHDDIENIVKEDKKQRYQLQGNKIRASQGHSIEIEMNFEKLNSIKEVYPLVHATYKDSIIPINESGLKSMSRTHIHFASIKTNDFKMIRKDTDTYCVLKKNYQKDIFKSENNVYLSKEIVSKEDFNIVTFTKKLNCYGGIIFDEKLENIIVVETDKNNIGFPKGKRHKEELPFETALREVNEETSLEIENINFIENIISIDEMSSNGNTLSIGYFIGWTSKSDLQMKDKEELQSVRWVKIIDAISLLSEKRKIVLEKVLDIIRK